jgi:6-phosphofructokinase 2
VDTSGPALRAAAEAGVFLLKPSLNELSGQASRPLGSEREIAAAARQLLDAGPNHAVPVSVAAEGALLVGADEPVVRICPPAVRAVSAIGAGDSLVAGMVLALDRGEGLVDAARFGVAAGTATTISSGHSLCRAEDVDRILPEMYAQPLPVLSGTP